MFDRRAAIALGIGVLVVVLTPRPPKTPSSVKGRQALTRWGCGVEAEDPLYRTIEARPARGVERWTVVSGSHVIVEAVHDGDLIEPLRFPVTGGLRFDTHNLDDTTGRIDVELSPSGKRAGDVQALLAAWIDEAGAEVQSAALGTAPRFVDGTARGEVTYDLVLGAWRRTFDGAVEVRRIDDDTFAVTSPLPTTGTLDAPGTGRLVQDLARVWGFGGVSEDLQLRFSLVVRREAVRPTSSEGSP